jgi:membrane-bound lytic murein transglycosylase D
MRFFLPLLLAAALASGCASTSPPPGGASEGATPPVTAADGRLGDNLSPPHPPQVDAPPAEGRARPAIPFDPNAILESPRKPGIDLTQPPASLWTRIRNGFGLPDISSPLVREQEDWYAARPDYLRRVVERSRRYLYYIVEEVEKRGMPTEIVLLPVIESAYNPTAYSRAHAAGMWQFIPSTGKNYGLQQNWWYDGRRDVLAATGAALDYLEKLYDQFGSWDLALAAYNWGEGGVARAIAKNEARGLPTDYMSLTMPQETRYYVPKLQAVKNIIADPARFGIQLADVPNQPYFVAVATDRPIDARLAARLAEIPYEEFISLNPGHARPVIRASDSPMLLVPVDKAHRFHANLSNHDQPLVSWQAYVVRKGERPEQIAARHGITLARLQEVNGVRRIGPGTTLLVPATGGTAHLPDLPAPPLKTAQVPAPPKTKKTATAQRSPAAGTKKAVAKAPVKRTAAVKAPARAKPAPKPAVTAQR